ncbi:MAG: UbiH/UbiF/VisC/COQ6 family ubiquinone biosynthesis hydroxylase [Mangrovicoccus sp.]
MDNPVARPITLLMQDADILITGGSLNGASLALALAGAGLRVTVIDALSQDAQLEPAFDGRSYALAHASVQMLRVLGLWDALADTAQPILGIKVSDGRAGEAPSPFVLEFDHAELEEGPMGQMVEDRHLRRVLLNALGETPGVTHLPGRRVMSQEIKPLGARLVLDDGTELSAPLLVGADGRQGPTGPRAGIKRHVKSYGQTALVCALSHEHPHDGIAHQYFMPAGPLAILPLKGNRCSIVWSESEAQAKAINALPEAEYLQVLRPRFGDFLGRFELAGARYTYPLTLTWAERFATDRVALVGDAARGLHPIAGQGLNAGLRDMAALAEIVAQAHRRGEDIGRADVLERYTRWRRFDSVALAAAMDGFNRIFSNDNPLMRLGRDLGMGVVNAVPSLRRAAMRNAAGLAGDRPRLLRGLQI